MTKVLFYYQDKPYYIYDLNHPSLTTKPLPQETNLSLDQIYQTCFSNFIPNVSRSLVSFTQGKGITILVTDINHHSLFLISIIKNQKTGCLELFNICKDLKQTSLSGYYFIKTIIDYFICDNPLFQDYPRIRLALLCDNPYLVPALKTYCLLGFQLETPKMPLVSMLDNYQSMIRPLYGAQPSNFSDQLRLMVEKCQYSIQEKQQLFNALHNGSVKIKWDYKI